MRYEHIDTYFYLFNYLIVNFKYFQGLNIQIMYFSMFTYVLTQYVLEYFNVECCMLHV